MPEPERLVNIGWVAPDAGAAGDALSYPLFRDVEADSSALAGIAAQVQLSVNLTLDEGRALEPTPSPFPAATLRL